MKRLNREINAVLQEPSVREALTKQAFEPRGGTPEEFGKVIHDSIGTWAAVIRANDIRLD